ncbi:hypothetical protein AgCh_009444 [Apium graveolens]
MKVNMADQEEYRCFIGNLSWSTSDRDLKDAFKKFGRLLDAKQLESDFQVRGTITVEPSLMACSEEVLDWYMS